MPTKTNASEPPTGTKFTKPVTGDRRSVMQQAKLAVRDIYDAIVELVTNCDDRYQVMGCAGAIEVIIKRSRGSPQLLQVRDSADGMTTEVMEHKLSRTGGRVSGMEKGFDVRGTNSRGAKDIAALGDVTFQSVAKADGRVHTCMISHDFFIKFEKSKVATRAVRKSIGIDSGTGTRVTIALDKNVQIQQHDKLVQRIQNLVPLRDILSDAKRSVILCDSSRTKRVVLKAPVLSGKLRVNETIQVPGYPNTTAKLKIYRSDKPFDREVSRFRLGGILIKSKHAIHEATYFDRELETNPHALRFYGRLVCPHIDDLWNEFDERFGKGPEVAANRIPIIDPSRRGGVTREHPFVQSLFDESRKRLRVLVEEERQLEENQRATIESRATRRRLSALEKAATKFMHDYAEDDEEESSRDTGSVETGSKFKIRGYVLSPPYFQLIKGHSRVFALKVNQEVFPELETGATAQIQCLSQEITSNLRFASLEPHPNQPEMLQAIWKIKAEAATPATGVNVQAGPISAEVAIEVFETEADKYKDISNLQFSKKRYRLYTDGRRKKLRVFAPIDQNWQQKTLTVTLPDRHFKMVGPKTLAAQERLGIATGVLTLESDGTEATGTVAISLDEAEATAELHAVPAPGAGLRIEIEDIDLKNQRSRWRHNVLEIAARHPSVSRYLGLKSDGYPGQESKHFRLLVAEIVADAICYKLMTQNVGANSEEYEDADWDQYYSEYTRYMTLFLPIAHKHQLKE